MRIGELRTVEWLEETARMGLCSTLATRPELRGMFADAPLESVVFVDEVYDGWQVIYIRVQGEIDGDPNALTWYAEATEADTLEAKGWLAPAGAGEWTPTHGDHYTEEELEAAEQPLTEKEQVTLAALAEPALPILPAKPQQRATVASLSRGMFHVVLQYVDAQGNAMWDMPSINLPARDMDHAWRIAEAINS